MTQHCLFSLADPPWQLFRSAQHKLKAFLTVRGAKLCVILIIIIIIISSSSSGWSTLQSLNYFRPQVEGLDSETQTQDPAQEEVAQVSVSITRSGVPVMPSSDKPLVISSMTLNSTFGYDWLGTSVATALTKSLSNMSSIGGWGAVAN
jgi:hypothetical protein